MSSVTRSQAIREALLVLGPAATALEVGRYVERLHGHHFDDQRALAVFIAMVRNKMSRKPYRPDLASSGSGVY